MSKILLITIILTGVLLFGYFGYEHFSHQEAPVRKEKDLIEIIPFQPGEEKPCVVFSKCKFATVKVIKFEAEYPVPNKENTAEREDSPEIIITNSKEEINSIPDKERSNKNKLSLTSQIEVWKKEASEIKKIIDNYENLKPEEIRINTDFADRASELRTVLEKIYNQGQEKKKERDKLNNEYKRAGQEMRTARSKNEASGWYYIYDKSKSPHSMKQEPSGGKGPVKYIFPKDDRNLKAQEKIKPDMEKAENEFKELSEKFSDYKQHYLTLKKDYKTYLENKNEDILKQVKEAEAQIEKLTETKKQEQADSARENKS